MDAGLQQGSMASAAVDSVGPAAVTLWRLAELGTLLTTLAFVVVPQ